MACEVEKVLAAAAAEVGYLEKKDGNLKYLYGKTANAGDKNYTKYGYEMHRVYPAVMDYPAYWCDAFVDWLFYKSYGIANAKRLLGGDFNDYTIASAALYKGKKAWHQTPRVGDQVFFWNFAKKIHHTGLVVEVGAQHFYTVEGNTSDGSAVIPNGGAVCRKKYAIGDSRIAGFGRPAYDKQPAFTPHWVCSNGIWYYRVADGENAHGWQGITNADGKTRWYYFDPASGRMLTGWQEIGGKWYYMQPSGDLEGALWHSDDSGAQYIWEL